MKITDDYRAKIKLWAANPQVAADMPPKNMPKFRSKKFNSYEEYNAWRCALLREIARSTPGMDESLQDQCLIREPT